MNRQSFKIGFYNEADLERLRIIEWAYLSNDLILVRQWEANESCTEDPLDTVPQKALIHNIPEAMWEEEAIDKITR